METMLVALLPGELASHFFKAIFLSMLPGDLKDLVPIQFQQLAPMELARFADVIWDTRNSKKTVVSGQPQWRRRQLWRRRWQLSPSTGSRDGMAERVGVVINPGVARAAPGAADSLRNLSVTSGD